MIKISLSTLQLERKIKELSQKDQRAVAFATRKTINDIAFSSRFEIIDNSEKVFTIRQKNFIKSRTIVDKKAKGYDVSAMYATVGIFAKNSSNSEKPVMNLKAHEEGGRYKIGNVPTDEAHISKDNRKKISKAKALNKSIKAGRIKGRKDWVKWAYRASKSKKNLMTDDNVFSITRFRYTKQGAKWNQKLLYNKPSNRTASVSRTNFVSKPVINYFNRYAQRIFEFNLKHIK